MGGNWWLWCIHLKCLFALRVFRSLSGREGSSFHLHFTAIPSIRRETRSLTVARFARTSSARCDIRRWWRWEAFSVDTLFKGKSTFFACWSSFRWTHWCSIDGNANNGFSRRTISKINLCLLPLLLLLLMQLIINDGQNAWLTGSWHWEIQSWMKEEKLRWEHIYRWRCRCALFKGHTTKEKRVNQTEWHFSSADDHRSND